MPEFITPQSATAHIKRVLRENRVSPQSVRTSRTADDRYLSYVFMAPGASDATYAKAAAVLAGEGYVPRIRASDSCVTARSEVAVDREVRRSAADPED